MSSHAPIRKEILDLVTPRTRDPRPGDDPTSDLAALWALRALLRSDVARHVRYPHGLDSHVAATIGLPDLASERNVRNGVAKAAKRLRKLERAGRHREAPVLRSVRHVARKLGMGDVEEQVLGVAVLCAVDAGLERCFHDGVTRVSALAEALGQPRQDVRRALDHDGVLHAGGLLSPWEFAVCDEIAEPLVDGVASVAPITRAAVRRSRSSALTLADFAHVQKDVAVALGLLRGGLARGARGLHVLLHGAPGTGKTELSRVLARELGASLHEVLDQDEDGGVAERMERLAKVVLADRVLRATRGALLLFDEAEEVLALGRDAVGPARNTTRAKGWTHRMLENARVPTIWTANAIDQLDPATLRRFAFVLELPVPPQTARRRILESKLGSLGVSAQWLDRTSADERLSPAHVEQAARGVRLVGARSPRRVEETLTIMLDRNLAAGGAPRPAAGASPCGKYEAAFVNASVDVEGLIAALGTHPHASVCLYGPPGTGKTALAAEVARRLGMPFRARRTSDLLSMWLGETESKIAAMFRDAAAERALLFLDECDGLLRERATARHSWEVTQVNELLVQVEAFDGVFFCATNLVDQLDVASLRRFALKVEMKPLRAEQRRAMFARVFGDLAADAPARLDRLDGLTPGDFAAVARQVRLAPAGDAERIVDLLRREIDLRGKRTGGRRIGFGAA